MAAGDVVIAHTSVANAASLTAQPLSGDEWIIHNIYAPTTAAIEVYRTDGTNAELVMESTGSIYGFNLHATNSVYFTVKNVSGAVEYLGYDGMKTVE